MKWLTQKVYIQTNLPVRDTTGKEPVLQDYYKTIRLLAARWNSLTAPGSLFSHGNWNSDPASNFLITFPTYFFFLLNGLVDGKQNWHKMAIVVSSFKNCTFGLSNTNQLFLNSTMIDLALSLLTIFYLSIKTIEQEIEHVARTMPNQQYRKDMKEIRYLNKFPLHWQTSLKLTDTFFRYFFKGRSISIILPFNFCVAMKCAMQI